MKKYVVRANPKGGTCYQTVMANSEEEAVEIAKAEKAWQHAHPKTMADWRFSAFEK